MQYLSIKNILIVYHLHYTSLAILNQKTSHQQYVFEMWIACSFYIIWSSLWSQVAVFKSSVIWWPTGNACYFLENTNVPQTGKAYQTTLWRVLAYHVIAYCTLFKSVIGDINMKFFITYIFCLNKHWFPLFTLYFVYSRNKLKSETRCYHLTLSRTNVVNYITFEFKK
mgnify:CR=1 FL=1